MNIPWYLRWYFIIAVNIFFPVGTVVSIVLLFMRLQKVPSSRGNVGLVMALLNGVLLLVFLAMAANSDGWGWLWMTFAVFSAIYLAVGVRMLLDGRRGQKYIELVHQKRLPLADDVAKALGRTDVDRVMEEIQKAIDQGWLPGYQVDRVSRRIHAPAAPALNQPPNGPPPLERCPWCGVSRPVGVSCPNGHPA